MTGLLFVFRQYAPNDLPLCTAEFFGSPVDALESNIPASGDMTDWKEQRYEGGWGWITVMSAFLAEFIVFGSMKALGVLITAMKGDFDTDLWIVGSLSSLHLGVQFALSK